MSFRTRVQFYPGKPNRYTRIITPRKSMRFSQRRSLCCMIEAGLSKRIFSHSVTNYFQV
jgi:hypothetical protein